MRPAARPALLALASAASAFVLAAGTTTPAVATTPQPTHLYAPYFETWTTDGITATAQASGTKHYTLAFVETPKRGSCEVVWNGEAGQPISAGRYLSDIASLRAMGGDVFPSFGGWSADQGDREIADSCKDVGRIADAYKQVITTYDVSRLDMDIEGKSLGKPDGIDRRNKAIRIVQDWAAAQGRPLEIAYTMPTAATGLVASGRAVLENAIANGVRVDSVNIMTFDYYDHSTTDMGAAALTAAQGTYDQLAALYPGKSSAELWHMIGITLMPGIDDFPQKTEVTYVADAAKVLDFARAKGLGLLSIWAIQRDNGGCPGIRGDNSCSGIAQNTWDFSHLLEPYTGS